MRHEWVLLVGLLSAPAMAADSYDPAYVDSPQSKAEPDPARADGNSSTRARTQAQIRSDEDRHTAERAAEAERQIAERMNQFAAAHAATLNQQMRAGASGSNTSSDIPVGGRDLIREATDERARSGSARQSGSALLDDAAAVSNANLGQEILGPDGRVIAPTLPQSGPDRGPDQ